MRYLLCGMCFCISSCASLIYPASPEELKIMDPISVCKEVGESKWQGNAEAYINANKEASKRIANNEITQSDCNAIAEMTVIKKDKLMRSLNEDDCEED